MNDVGFPSLDRSHFRCQDVWQTADEGSRRDHKPRIGWAGRYADTYLGGSGSTLTTIAIGNKIPLGMTVRQKRPAVLADAQSFVVNTPGRDALDAETLAAMRDLYAIARDNERVERVRAYGADLFDAHDRFDAGRATPSTVRYPEGSLAHALRTTAALLAEHPEARIVWVKTGGYDAHAKQAPQHALLLSDIAPFPSPRPKADSLVSHARSWRALLEVAERHESQFDAEAIALLRRTSPDSRTIVAAPQQPAASRWCR